MSNLGKSRSVEFVQLLSETVADPSVLAPSLAPLPPREEIGGPVIREALEQAVGALGRLDELRWTLAPHVWSGLFEVIENQASTAIEGLHTPLLTLLIDDEYKEQIEGRDEIARSLLALREARTSLKRLPVCTRMAESICTTIGGNGIRKLPGTVLRDQDSGQVVYTPPVGERTIRNLLANWEEFVNAQHDGFDPLIRAVVAHGQFESIHPFYDGNGRTGRILLQLQLVQDQVFKTPVLCISKALLAHKARYYQLLNGLRQPGGWEEWTHFMLNRVTEAAVWQRRRIELYRALKAELRHFVTATKLGDLGDFNDPLLGPVCWTIGDCVRRGYGNRGTISKRFERLVDAGVFVEHIRRKKAFYVSPRLLEIMDVEIGADLPSYGGSSG